MNVNLIKGLGLVILTGMTGGLIAQKIGNKVYEKRIKEYAQEIQDLRTKFIDEMDSNLRSAKDDLQIAVKSIVNNAIDSEARKALSTEVTERVRQLNIESFAESAAEKSMEKAVNRAQDKLYGEASEQLKKTVRTLAERTVKERLKDEMYQVNSRRIIEDSVDRAVREEVHSEIKKKLKWANFNNMSDLKAFIL